MAITIPTLSEGSVTLRPIRVRDARLLEASLMENRGWLRKWEATNPYAPMSFDTRSSIRNLLAHSRSGHGLPFLVEYDGELAGQLNVSGISWGSLSSASLGYWVGERFAGRSITPTAVALATDYCFYQLGLHRMEICIRPENDASLRVVQKLGFRYEGLRRRFIHINGDWRDHFCFGLTAEELQQGVLRRWRDGLVPPYAAAISAADLAAAAHPLPVIDR
ncbi:GNAT family N-acetyltransferase [Glaciibacter psychrotolerans]|uniref:Ribosomal-protein-alanine N-acetyltransferase n=1 Tax=Glaciibacter psychrotolerans TaxID=670054 RepID=A0A7Z0J4P6_9MICO|nr:GNAT family protein [Leifsonia psychrotolerans]NYJ18306.1 ribosomal-protein-alanine N-acetyltransferase [Leifsonia psychrotolerans]